MIAGTLGRATVTEDSRGRLAPVAQDALQGQGTWPPRRLAAVQRPERSGNATVGDPDLSRFLAASSDREPDRAEVPATFADSLTKDHSLKHPNTFFLGGLLCAAFFVTACDSKVAECNKVADIVNAGAKDMATLDSAMAKDAGDGAKTVRAVADAAKKTKTDIEALTIKTEELKPKVAAYVALMDDFVTQTTTFADLLAQSSAADDETTQKAFESAQDALVQACSTESPDCTKVGEVMEKQPDQVADDKFPGMLEQYAKDLGALSLEHETTKAAVTKLKAATEAYAKFAQDVATNQAKLADAGKQLDELGAKEDTVVDDLNGYCLGTAK